ncbi:MAG: T9SS type A sorting domain-containing protein [Syntrophothermus sp.]
MPEETNLGTINQGKNSIQNKTNNQILLKYHLAQNYPNPFNPSTVIDYYLESAGSVTLSVYDPLGRCVAVLAQGEQAAGKHSLNFNASALSSGLYIYSLNVSGKILSSKISVIK